MRRIVSRVFVLLALAAFLALLVIAVRRSDQKRQVEAIVLRFGQALLAGDVAGIRDPLTAEFDRNLVAGLAEAESALKQEVSAATVEVTRVRITEPQAQARLVFRADKARVSLTIRLVREDKLWRISGWEDVSQHPRIVPELLKDAAESNNQATRAIDDTREVSGPAE